MVTTITNSSLTPCSQVSERQTSLKTKSQTNSCCTKSIFQILKLFLTRELQENLLGEHVNLSASTFHAETRLRQMKTSLHLQFSKRNVGAKSKVNLWTFGCTLSALRDLRDRRNVGYSEGLAECKKIIMRRFLRMIV